MYVLAVLALTMPPSLAYAFFVATEFKREQLKKANDTVLKNIQDAWDCGKGASDYAHRAHERLGSLEQRVAQLEAHDAETQQSLNRLLDRQY